MLYVLFIKIALRIIKVFLNVSSFFLFVIWNEFETKVQLSKNKCFASPYECLLSNLLIIWLASLSVNNALHSSHRAFWHENVPPETFSSKKFLCNDCPTLNGEKCVMNGKMGGESDRRCEKRFFLFSSLYKIISLFSTFCRLLISWFFLLRHRDIFMIPYLFFTSFAFLFISLPK